MTNIFYIRAQLSSNYVSINKPISLLLLQLNELPVLEVGDFLSIHFSVTASLKTEKIIERTFNIEQGTLNAERYRRELLILSQTSRMLKKELFTYLIPVIDLLEL